MATGHIKDWFGDKGYGFIVDDAGGKDVFFHIKQSPVLKSENLYPGAKVVFDKKPSKRHQGRFDAHNVHFPSSDARAQGVAASKQSYDKNDYFYNPYTFVPSSPRRAVAPGTFAGDFDPLKHGLDHASLQPKLWTGHMPIKLTTVTPLVLPDAGCEERSPTEHQTYDMLTRLPEPSLRGMLRSAYESVTNSRYGCFKNEEKLPYRAGRRKQWFTNSPADLLDASLKPAAKMCNLSPADRLFGWTPQGQVDNGGYKGRIRVVCDDGPRPGIITRFDETMPLAILGQPKPAQGRFYVAKDGKPQDGTAKENAGYDGKGKSLRGRKQYWHHKGLEAKRAANYWSPPVGDPTQQSRNDRYPEYRRPNRDGNPQTDSQNRSITGWIKHGTVFSVTLYVHNLQSEEVGALLWLLSLPETHYFRLGYGKPLGFGSVRMEVDTDRCANGCLPLGTGEDWKKYYAAFDACSPATLGGAQREVCLQAFKTSMLAAYDPLLADSETAGEERFGDLPFIEGFVQALKGPENDEPIHYPREEANPNPRGENFKWFVANEYGKKLALPAVTEAKGLPYKP